MRQLSLLLFGALCLLLLHVSEAKVGGGGAKSDDNQGVDSWLLEKELEADLKDLEALDEEDEEKDGSGEYEYDDDEDEDEDEYEDDEGSGLDSFPSKSSSSFEDTFIDDLEHGSPKKNKNKVSTDDTLDFNTAKDSDIHFEEDDSEDDDLLSEYYDEEYEPDYYEDEEDIVVKTQTETQDSPSVVFVPAKPKAEPGVLDQFLRVLRPSYVYITLASALLSFALALAAFFLCRRQSAHRRSEKKLVPFVVGDHMHLPANNGGSIVKSYQRVPTTTREFLSSSTRVEMPPQPEKKGLLA